MEKKWWHDKVAYQIYPKSFCDSNGDGIGDLPGILSKLDYLQALGVEILWLSPVYQSPFVDQGYDISDYYAIAEPFGTMEQFDALLAEAKRRGMYIVMDLVANHCSDQHPWFQKALADPQGEYGQLFYFRKGKNGGPPCNYRSYFGGSAWEPVPGRPEWYYLHFFAKEQPDLNWENPALRQKIYEMVNWWMDKGVAGFRIDAISNIKKDLTFADLPADGPDGLAGGEKAVRRAEGVGALLTELKQETFAKHDAFTVGEVFETQAGTLADFIGPEGYFSSMFDFSGSAVCAGAHGWYDAPAFDFTRWRDAVLEQQAQSEGVGFLANILENHDEPRSASWYLPPFAQTPAGVKMLATVSVLLRGLPFLYQGQELGMTNYPWPSMERSQDVSARGEYRRALDAGVPEAQARAICLARSRDNTRTPMQWSAAPGAGFTTGTPWLPINPNYPAVNAAAQAADPDSVLNYYKKLIALRKSAPWRELFVYGRTQPAPQQPAGVFAYLRTDGARRVLVAASCRPDVVSLPLPGRAGRTLLGSQRPAAQIKNGALTLKSCEAVVLELI